MFEYDGTGVSADGFSLIPDGWFPFQVFDTEEGESKSGHKQVLVKAACLDARHKDKTIWHWVTFLPKENKGAGMALHFLKSIGEPHEGKLNVECGFWKGRRFMGKVFTDTYNGKRNNKFEAVSPYREGTPENPEPEATTTQVSDEDIPF